MARIVKEHDERRSEILGAAQVLFYAKGYRQTSVRDIIDVVGIAKGTFYHYFSSKAQLLDELIERMLDHTVQMVEPIINDDQLDALEKFHLFFGAIENWKIENKTFLRSVLAVYYDDDNAVFRHKIKAASVAATALPLAKIIRQGIDDAVFKTRYPDEIGEIIIVIGQSLAENLAFLLMTEDGSEAAFTAIEHKIAVTQYAMERVLGAPAGSVKIFDIDRLSQWFEEDEVQAKSAAESPITASAALV